MIILLSIALQSDVIFDSDSKGNQTIHVRRFKFDGYVKIPELSKQIILA